MQSRTQIFILTFSCYVGIHALRTSYSYSKEQLSKVIHINDKAMMGKHKLIQGLVDALLLIFLGIGHFIHAIYPIKKPVQSLYIGMILCGINYGLIPFFFDFLKLEQYYILLVLMSINGFLQSYTWPNLVMIIHSKYDSKRDAFKLGFWAVNTNIGNILGYLVCQNLLNELNWGWQSGLYIVAGFTIVNSVLVFIRIKELKKSSPLETQQISQQYYLEGEPLNQKQQLQNFVSIKIVFKDINIMLITAGFSLVKSIIYGILLWLPLYFKENGFKDIAGYVPITYDIASVIGSLILGYAFNKVHHKGPLLAPLMAVLVVLLAILKYANMTAVLYFVLIAGVGLCLGGSFNTMAGLITMELSKLVPPKFQSTSLGFYSALLMSCANIMTAGTQLLIGFAIRQDESQIFLIFMIYSAIALLCFIFLSYRQIKSKRNQKLAFSKLSQSIDY